MARKRLSARPLRENRGGAWAGQDIADQWWDQRRCMWSWGVLKSVRGRRLVCRAQPAARGLVGVRRMAPLAYVHKNDAVGAAHVFELANSCGSIPQSSAGTKTIRRPLWSGAASPLPLLLSHKTSLLRRPFRIRWNRRQDSGLGACPSRRRGDNSGGPADFLKESRHAEGKTQSDVSLSSLRRAHLSPAGQS